MELNDGNLLLYADDILLYHPIYCLDDYVHLQQNIDKLYMWSEVNLLQFNPAKYIVVFRKRNPLLPVPGVNINDAALIKVDHYKYLGVWLSHNLSWSKHIEETCKSASKQIDLICRIFYLHSSQAILRFLYVSLVCSKLEYAAAVWDPQQTTIRHSLEKTKTFALKVCTKTWSSDYAYHLNVTNLPFLSTRLYLKLTFLFQILNGSFVYPNAPLVKLNLSLNLRNSNNIQFKRPICHNNVYMNSFSLTLYLFGTTYHMKYRAVLHYHLLNVVLCRVSHKQ